MRVVVFILCFCSLLLKGNTGMLTLLQPAENSYSQYPHGHRLHQCRYTHNSSDFSSVADTDASAEYLLDSDDEDEDHKNIAADKFRQMATSHATHAYPSYPSILNYLCKSFKASPSVCLPATDLYIDQGVLRI